VRGTAPAVSRAVRGTLLAGQPRCVRRIAGRQRHKQTQVQQA
jgi:hypothetical protein